MTQYNWRQHWQVKTRGGFEVVDVRPMGDDLFVCWWSGNGYDQTYVCKSGLYRDGRIDRQDLLPVEQRTDTEGRDVTGLYGLHDESDTVTTIAALTAELERWRTLHGADNVEDSIAQDARGSLQRLLADRLEQIRALTAERDAAIKLLAQWCWAIDRNGTGWDDWDEHYKDAAFRPGPLRQLIDTAIEREKNPPTESEAAS